MRPRVGVAAVVPLVAALALAACAGPRYGRAKHHSARHQHVAAAPDHTTSPAAAPQHQRSPSPVQSRPHSDTHVHRTLVTHRPRPVNHCRFNDHTQKAIVSLAEQHMWMCVHRRTVYDTAITSGKATRNTRTPTGIYMVQGRNRNTTLTLQSGATYHVRFWIPFNAPWFGFHDSPWQHFPYGSPKYRTHGSHGCIHMPLRAIQWFYRWVARPTAVHIS